MLPDLVPAPRPCVTEKEQRTPHSVLVLESWPGGRRYPEAAKNQMGQASGTEHPCVAPSLAHPGRRDPEGKWKGRRGRTILSWTVGGGG